MFYYAKCLIISSYCVLTLESECHGLDSLSTQSPCQAIDFALLPILMLQHYSNHGAWTEFVFGYVR